MVSLSNTPIPAWFESAWVSLLPLWIQELWVRMSHNLVIGDRCPPLEISRLEHLVELAEAESSGEWQEINVIRFRWKSSADD
jgi:hypothetical protein